MTRIRVNPISVLEYGAKAQTYFDEMRRALVLTVDQATSVHYYGPNATTFKIQCGLLAASFANQLSESMGLMAEAVQDSTSRIAASLGGAPVSIAVETQAIAPPNVPSVDYVDLDTSALEALTPLIGTNFSALKGGLDHNLKALVATDWAGTAKDRAVEDVTKYTAQSELACDGAKDSLDKFIRDQLSSVIGADR